MYRSPGTETLWLSEPRIYNPLREWNLVKVAMEDRVPLRMNAKKDGLPVHGRKCNHRIANSELSDYAGYLFPYSGNCYVLAKHGSESHVFTFSELMQMVLGEKLWIDKWGGEMPEYYKRFLKLARMPDTF